MTSGTGALGQTAVVGPDLATGTGLVDANKSVMLAKVQCLGPILPILPIQPIQPVQPIIPVQPVQPIVPIQPVHPIVPIQPINPIGPIVNPGPTSGPTSAATFTGFARSSIRQWPITS